MKKVVIGIPAHYDHLSDAHTKDLFYLDAIRDVDAEIVIIPIGSDIQSIEAKADKLDGVLLPGSPSDISPSYYQCKPHQKLGRVISERDKTDFVLLDIAETRGIPILGICYGAQSLNVYRGGTLIQDIASEIPGAVDHDRDGEPQEIESHSVLLDGAWMESIYSCREVKVNSYHHQSVDLPGKNLRIVGVAPDGVVEAIEDTRGLFSIGVQWHPETGWQSDPFARALFSAFVAAARDVQ